MPIRTDLAGESLYLHPQRALYWESARSLVVADVHLGKACAFQRQGIAVPEGSTAADLQRLDALIRFYVPARLLVLGDLFHARLRGDDAWMRDFDAFRARHPQLRIEVLRGNHDRGLEQVPAQWRLHWHQQPLFEAPFVFSHEPIVDPRGYGLCGHLHPVMRLRSAVDRVRLPVFWFRRDHGVLPSFGGFTGGHGIQPSEDERVFVATPETVLEVPTRLAPQTHRRNVRAGRV